MANIIKNAAFSFLIGVVVSLLVTNRDQNQRIDKLEAATCNCECSEVEE